MLLFIHLLLNALLIRCALACQNGLLLSQGVPPEDQEIIVDVHNRYRQAISLGHIRGQPSASNMLEITWAKRLAKEAQKWANMCIFAHDPQLSSDPATAVFTVGQNLAETWNESPQNESSALAEWASQIRNWFNELYIFGNDENLSGHFSQVIWSDSDSIGCGYSYYQTQRTRFVKLYVCNYLPSGNIIGKPPYREGPPECGLKYLKESENYLGLCEVLKPS